MIDDMAKDFDFDKIGKRMPYTVPDRCFEEMERRVWAKVSSDAVRRKRRRRTVMLASAATFAAAASVALAVMLDTAPPAADEAGMEAVQHAFAALSADDQDYVLQVYEEDIFMNQ